MFCASAAGIMMAAATQTNCIAAESTFFEVGNLNVVLLIDLVAKTPSFGCGSV